LAQESLSFVPPSEREISNENEEQEEDEIVSPSHFSLSLFLFLCLAICPFLLSLTDFYWGLGRRKEDENMRRKTPSTEV